MRVEIFDSTNLISLQNEINDFLKWLKDEGNELIDIKFSTNCLEENEYCFTAMVIYTYGE